MRKELSNLPDPINREPGLHASNSHKPKQLNLPSGNKFSPPHHTQPLVTDSPITFFAIPQNDREFFGNYKSATAPIHKISNHDLMRLKITSFLKLRI